MVSHLVLHPTSIQNGFVKCYATNELGEDSVEVEYYVSGKIFHVVKFEIACKIVLTMRGGI